MISGATQQESECNDKRYPLPVSIQLQTCTITYHCCFYHEVIRVHDMMIDIATNESVFVLEPSDSTRVSTSAGFYSEDIIPVLFTTEAFTAKLPSALKAKEDYQQLF